jgi:hypothetical protein
MSTLLYVTTSRLRFAGEVTRRVLMRSRRGRLLKLARRHPGHSNKSDGGRGYAKRRRYPPTPRNRR